MIRQKLQALCKPNEMLSLANHAVLLNKCSLILSFTGPGMTRMSSSEKKWAGMDRYGKECTGMHKRKC